MLPCERVLAVVKGDLSILKDSFYSLKVFPTLKRLQLLQSWGSACAPVRKWEFESCPSQ